jgi:hypothetical protein
MKFMKKLWRSEEKIDQNLNFSIIKVQKYLKLLFLNQIPLISKLIVVNIELIFLVSINTKC